MSDTASTDNEQHKVNKSIELELTRNNTKANQDVICDNLISLFCDSNKSKFYEKSKFENDAAPNLSELKMENENNIGSLPNDKVLSDCFMDKSLTAVDAGILKAEDVELLAKLEAANRLFEADSKSLVFSNDSTSKSSSSTGCKKVSTSSAPSSAHSRQGSTSSQQSTCSHDIGVPCSCSPSFTDFNGCKEPLDDNWSTWRNIVDDWEQYKQKTALLKELVRKGIPSHFRGLVWPLISGAHNSNEKSKYKDYLRMSSKFEKFIRRDVSRTYPDHEMFKELDGPGQESLFNVIKAYSLLDPEVGYCQGSAFVVGLLLMQMPEEDAFAVFVEVMYRYGLRELYKPSMAKIELCIYQLECMIQDLNPSLYNHFQMHGMFASTFATPWFLSIFATSFPLPLSCRVFDIFLSEGMNSIMMLSYAMIEVGSQELLKRNMEEMIKLLSKELPKQLEECPSKLFNTAFNVKFCPKKMKKLEKDYNCIKTKETEDNIERKRLKTENRLLRQRIEKLEEETSTLADRLIQDQVKYANQAEELYVLRRKSLLSSDSVKDGAAIVVSPDLVVSPGKNTVSLQAQLEEMVAKEVSLLSEKQELEMKVYDLEKHLHRKTYESRSFDLNDLQEQLMLSKLREAETSTTAKELEQKVLELDKYWQKHQELMNCGDDKPKVQKAKIQVLTEELMSSKLKEANLVKDLMELKLKVVDLETKFHVEHRLVKKLEEENEELKQKLSDFESSKLTFETEIRGLERQVSKAEAKQQNDDLMTKIKDAEVSQMIAELKQKIAQLEIQNQELLTAEKLYKGAGQNDDNLVDIDSKIEELHQQMVHLLKLKKDKMNGRTNHSKVSLNSLKKFYSVESDSDMDDFDSINYKLGDDAFRSFDVPNGRNYFGDNLGLNGLGKESNGEEDLNGNDPLGLLIPSSRRSRIRSSVASNCSSLSINVQDSVARDSPESDFSKDDILTGSAKSHNPDIILDFVLTDDFSNDFQPINQSSPMKISQSCNGDKKSGGEFDSGLDETPESNSSGVDSHMNVLSIDDPGKTPTNDLSVDSDSSSHFDFNSSNNNTTFLEVKNEKIADLQPKVMNISSTYFPDLLSVSNTLNEIARNDISSLIAGLDLPDKRCDKSMFIDTEEKCKVISDRNLSSSLDILSQV